MAISCLFLLTEEALEFATVRVKDTYDRHHEPIQFNVGQKVYLGLDEGYTIPMNKALGKRLTQQYAGKLEVKERAGPRILP